MKLFKTAAVCAALSLASWPAAAEPTVSMIEVQADLGAYENSNAMEYWPSLEADIALEIAKLVAVDETAEAPRMRVELNKVAVNGETFLPDGGEFNELEGTIVLLDSLNETTNTNVDGTSGTAERSFPLAVSAVTADVVVPEGVIVIPPSQDEFYRVLVEGFAAEAVKKIEG